MTAHVGNGHQHASESSIKYAGAEHRMISRQKTHHTATIHDLPDKVLLTIFKFVPTERNKQENRHALPLVCRRWRHIVDTEDAASLWSSIEVTLPSRDNIKLYSFTSLYAWLQKHSKSITSVTLEIKTIETWKTVYALLGLLGQNLTALKIFSDNDINPCHEVRDTAPWLALVPNLVSLELEGVVDTTIGKAELPSGLTGVALNGCGLNGLYKVPTSLTKLHNLQRLSLQFMETGADLGSIARLKTLQHLDLSHCNLRSIPEELTSLTSLTSLTLNNNEELGGANNYAHIAILEKLTGLQQLEMRDCALKSVPLSIIDSTSIKTLLLGYNDFTLGVDGTVGVDGKSGSSSGSGGLGNGIIPVGPYLSSLELLAISDCIHEPISAAETLVRPLASATSLRVLRLNRNWGLTLTTAVVANLLRGKTKFRKLEYSGDMASNLDLILLQRKFPFVTFKIID